jgi:hypothetical protein
MQVLIELRNKMVFINCLGGSKLAFSVRVRKQGDVSEISEALWSRSTRR